MFYHPYYIKSKELYAKGKMKHGKICLKELCVGWVRSLGLCDESVVQSKCIEALYGNEQALK